MKKMQVRFDRFFSWVMATVLGLFPTLVLAQGGNMQDGMRHMMGGMWLMGLIGILVIVVLALSAAALIKYLFRK